MRKLFVAVMMICLFSITNSPCLEAKTFSSTLYPAPGAQWEVFEQPFFRVNTIYRLKHVGDPRYLHQPFVAVDPSGQEYMLTFNVVHLSRQQILNDFNKLVREEKLNIDATNVEEYARFFVQVHGLTTPSISTIRPASDGYMVECILPLGESLELTIAPNGTIQINKND